MRGPFRTPVDLQDEAETPRVPEVRMGKPGAVVALESGVLLAIFLGLGFLVGLACAWTAGGSVGSCP